MASTYRYHDMGTPTLRTKFTWSVWIKRSELGTYATLASMWKNANEHFMLRFDDTDQLRFYYTDGSSLLQDLKTNALYRDISGWLNIVATFDSTENTASSRAKLYVNGEQITSFATSTYPSINAQPNANASGTDHYLGARGDGQNYGGLMSHCHFVDGAVYQASTFGSTDATTGEWKINTSPTITEYGTNGWFMFKDDASLTDRSGKSNNFTNQSGTLTQTEDCPSNVFAAFNALNNNSTLTNGNLTATTDNAQKFGSSSTLGVSSGKFYWEMKVNATYLYTGVDYDPAEALRNNDPIRSHGWCYNADGSVYNNGSGSSFGNTFTTGDIIGVALDATNSKLYFSKNGTWQNSGDPTSGSTGTGAVSITANETYFAVMGDGGSSVGSGASANFGNGYFGTTVISSEGTNASGIGKFEYDVPTGYTALSTKGLNL